MRLRIDKSFEKDTDKIHDQKVLLKIKACIEQVINCSTLDQITNLKKLKGFKNHYRIRVGDYRAGVTITNEEVVFERFLNRKDIYKYYP